MCIWYKYKYWFVEGLLSQLSINNQYLWTELSQELNGIVNIYFKNKYWFLEASFHTFHITTDVVSSNLDQGKVYNIMW